MTPAAAAPRSDPQLLEYLREYVKDHKPPEIPKDPPESLDCGCRPPREAWEAHEIIGEWRLKDRHVCDSGIAWGWCESDRCDGERHPPQASFLVETAHGAMELCEDCHGLVAEATGR